MVGDGRGGFRPAPSGEYKRILELPVPDNFSASSISSAVLSNSSIPGSSETGTKEAPDPPDPVVLSIDSHRHRPGPAVGGGRRGFRPATSGKYDCNLEHSVPENSSPSSNSVDKLHIYYQNVRGLRTKIDKFFLAVSEAEYDIIVLTETWLDDCIYSPQLFGSHYTVFRTDRSCLNSQKTRGGGVLIAVSTKLNCYLDPAPVSSCLEQLWVTVEVPLSTVSVGVIYLPPDLRNDPVLIQQHVESVASILTRLNFRTPALLFGDYNQPGLRWCFPGSSPPYVDVLLSHISTSCSALLDGFNLHGLTQINANVNRNGRLLDLVLANDSALPDTTVSLPPEPLIDLDADHPALDVTMNFSSPIEYESPSEFDSLDFRRADYAALSAFLSTTDWHFFESSPSVNDAVDYFCSTLEHAVSSVVPARRPPQKPPWSTSRLRALKRARSAALRKFCCSRLPYYKRQFNAASIRYRQYNHFLYNRHVKRTEENLRRNPRLFWSFVNSKRKEFGLPSTMFLGNDSASTEQEKCNFFARHFKQVFHNLTATPAQVNDATRRMPQDVFSFDIPRITENMVVAALGKLKLSFAAGPDGIPSSVLKRCALVLSYPLTELFNLSVQQNEFPMRWKFSNMFPVHKKGDKRNVTNYRGITSLCACSKLFEIIVNDALFSSCKNYIDNQQHGFYPKRSVSTNLMQFTSTCLRNMDSGLQVDAAYMDLKAAFDRVDHEILLGKLERLGVSMSSVAWFRSYLTNRCVRVKIGSSDSVAFSNRSGVPQGSNLGPLLFSIFINDLSMLLPPDCRFFYADDTKIFKVIRCLLDCQELQSMLSRFAEWCSRNFMCLSIDKCSIISFHRKCTPMIYDYMIAGNTLPRVQHVKDLGVILDSELTFRIHYSEIIAKANRQLGFIFKIADEFRDPLCFKSLYCSLVRSILESNAVIWCPSHANWIARIEAVQRRFVRYALRFLPWRDPQNLPRYEDRCRLLSIEPLETRRIVAQASFVGKLLTGDIDCPALLSQMNLYAPERQLRQRNFLYLEPRNRDYGLNEPVRAMSMRFNEHFELFDFNLSNSVFRDRILDLFRIVRSN